MAAILSAAMMCDWLGTRFADPRLNEVSAEMERAVAAVLREGKWLTYDLGGEAKCSESGSAVRDALGR
jgi:isocitrate/isopropylmalate dehydrogenase